MATCKLPTKWRVVRFHIGIDYPAESGGGSDSFTNTYAIPDDGRDLMEMTLAELQAYPAVTALAMLEDVVASLPTGSGEP